MVKEFPDDTDLLAELAQLRRENEALYEQRDRCAAAQEAADKRLRRIGRVLRDLLREEGMW